MIRLDWFRAERQSQWWVYTDMHALWGEKRKEKQNGRRGEALSMTESLTHISFIKTASNEDSATEAQNRGPDETPATT